MSNTSNTVVRQSRHAETVRWAFERGYRVQEDGCCLSPKGRLLIAHIATGRRYAVIVIRGSHKFCVHKLAAFQLFGEASFADGVHVRHLDGNSRNNSHANLALGTAAENNADKSREALARSGAAAARAVRRLTDEQVDAIRVRYGNGERGAALAQEFGVARSTLVRAVGRRSPCDINSAPARA